MKRIISLILVTVSLLCLFSCTQKDSEVPEGMALASVEGAPFKLFVPSNWTLNTHSGISSAYLNSMDIISVSADWMAAKEGETLESFYASALQSYKNEFLRFEVIDQSDITVDQRQAKKFTARLEFGGNEYKIMRVMIAHGGDFVIFTYKALTQNSLYDTYLENADIMLREFKLTEKSNIVRPNEKDEKTPAGMKMASGDNTEYVLYVPENWTVNSQAAVPGAYYSDKNRSNVTVTSYTPENSMSVEDYFKMGEESFKKLYDDYVFVSRETNKTLGGEYAEDFVFTFTFEGNQYKTRQMIAIYNQMFYVLTYTSTPENYDLLAADLEKIIAEFKFR